MKTKTSAVLWLALLAASLWPLAPARADNESEFQANSTGAPPEAKKPAHPCPGDQCCTPYEVKAAGSIDLLTGNEWYERTDLEISGIYPISFRRAYDSLSEYDSSLGYGWSSNYDLRLFRHKDNAVTIRGLCGMRNRFVLTGGAYQPFDTSVPGGASLSESNGTFTLQYRSGTKAVFLNTDDGRVSYLESPRGHRLVFTYTATKLPLTGTSPFASNTATPLTVAYEYQLLSIEEVLKSGTATWQPTGRKLKLTYSATTGRLTRVDTYDGRYVTYAQDADGNLTDVFRSVDATNTIHATYTYTLNGEGGDRHNLKSSTEGAGTQAVVRTYDATVPDRVVTETEGTRSISIDYDPTITLPTTRTLTTTIVDDAGGNPYTTATRYEFNSDGIPTKEIHALGDATLETMTTTERDLGTNAALVERTYRKQAGSYVLTRTIRTARDTLGNVTQREVVEATSDETVTTYTYDPAGLAANQTWVSVEDSYASRDPAKHFRTEYDFLRPCGNSSCSPAAVTRIRRFVDAANYLDTQLAYGTGPNFELETITLPDGHQIGLAYYTLTVPPANPTTQADFLAIAQNGRLYEIHHQPGGVPIAEMKTNYAYDKSGFVASVTRPVDIVQGDAVTQYLRDDLGRVAQLTDALGDLTNATYTGPDGTAPGELLTLLETGASTTVHGRRQKLVYDPRGRLLEVDRCTDYATTCGAYPLFRRFGYDSESNRLWAEDFSENPPGTLVARHTKLFYDLLGRVRRIEDPLSKATLFEYDERGNLAKRTDALSHITQWTYDALDRMVQETNAINGLTQLGYDAAGDVTSVKDPENSTTTYGYDGLSRLVAVTQPLGQIVQYQWDPRDRLAKKILARSSVGGSSEHPEIRYTYETWGPLQLAKHFAKSSDATPLKTITYVRNRAGDLTSVTDDSIQGGALYTYEVDKLGRTTKTFAKYIPGGDRRLDYAYDAHGDLTTFTLNEPNEVLAHVYTYAADSGRIATALFPGESTALVIARWPHDGVKSIDYPGGVRREVDYDVRGPVSEIRIKPPAGTPLIEKWTYTYTDVLNVATMTDGASRQTTYQYDALDRLTQADHPVMPPPLDSLPDVENFTYDGVGDRTMTGYAHDTNHRMRASPGHTYDYDDDGSLAVRDPNQPVIASFSWDLDNRLSARSAGGTGATYTYDPFGRRIRKTVPGITTSFLWNGRQLSAEFGGIGTRDRRYAYLGGWTPASIRVGPTLATETGGNLQDDRLDAPRIVTTFTGSVVWRATYEAFGRAYVDEDPDSNSVVTSLPMRLPGQYADSESGLHYNLARFFDPALGSFASTDPLGQDGGAIGLYAYARGNPTNLLDPSGESWSSAAESFVVSAAVGAATTVAVSAAVASGTAEGAALAVAAVGVGSYQLTIEAQRLLLGEDPYSGRQLTDEERYDIAAGLTGGLLGSLGAGYGLRAYARSKCPIPSKAPPGQSPNFRTLTNSPQDVPTEFQMA